MERDSEYDYEADTLSDSSRERNLQRVDKGKGKVLGEKLDDDVEREFQLEEHDDDVPPHHTQVIDLESPTLFQSMLLKEKEAHIHMLNDKLARARYIINYLEQENKQLEYKQVLMELQMIKEGRQKIKEANVPLPPVEQEIEHDRETWLERVNIHLEGLLKKANRDKNILWHMAHHYITRNKICNMSIKKLKARLRRALKSKKREDKLNILADITLAQQSNP